MKEITKTIHGKVFAAKAEEKLHFLLEPLFSAIENIPAEKLVNGFKIQAAFSVYTLEETENGFDILVPDYKNALKLTDDLTGALLVQYEQVMLLRMCAAQGENIRYDDVVLVAKGALGKDDICMQRFSDLGGSGWCINDIAFDEEGKAYMPDAEDYESLYAYQLILLRPELMKMLLLPYGYLVVFSGSDVADILNDKGESLLDDEGGIVQ